MVVTLFDTCVYLLYELAKLTGTTYKEINVIVFLVIWPALTVVLFVAWLKTTAKLRAVRRHSQTSAS